MGITFSISSFYKNTLKTDKFTSLRKRPSNEWSIRFYNTLIKTHFQDINSEFV